MGLLPILTYPDPCLKKNCAPVHLIQREIRSLIDDMIETMYGAPGVGLAAPQVGRPVRVMVMDVSAQQEGAELIALINPEILWSDGEILWEEGCLSVPELLVEVARKERVRVAGLEPSGKRIEFEAEGFLAIALQHEMDHLNGRLIIDRVSPLKRELYRKRRLKESAQAGA